MRQKSQYVRFKRVNSDVIYTNTGCPQGCVLSPLLFSLYTNDCISSFNSCSVIKYADDTVIIGRILNDDRNEYLHQVNDFVKWCDVNFLNLNVTKTKEMILDFRKKQTNFPPLVIKSENVERVKEYKCLGVIIDDQLSGSANTKSVYSKCIQRIHHLRILRNIGVDKNILSLFYKSMIESVLCFSITVWYGGLTGKSKHKLEKITKSGRKLGADVVSLSELYEKSMLQIIEKIMSDVSHPLHGNYVFLRSNRRLAVPVLRTSRFKNSFVPKSIKLYNHIKTKININ